MVGILRFLPRCQTPSSCSSTWTSALSPSWSTIGQSANWLSIFNTTIWLSLMQLNSNRFELSPHCVLWGSLITLRHPIGHIRHTPHDQKYNTPLYQVPWRCILWSSRENSLPHCLLSLGPLWGEKQFWSAVPYERWAILQQCNTREAILKQYNTRYNIPGDDETPWQHHWGPSHPLRLLQKDHQVNVLLDFKYDSQNKRVTLSLTVVFRSAVGSEGVARGDMSKLGLPNTIRDYLNYL